MKDKDKNTLQQQCKPNYLSYFFIILFCEEGVQCRNQTPAQQKKSVGYEKNEPAMLVHNILDFFRYIGKGNKCNLCLVEKNVYPKTLK